MGIDQGLGSTIEVREAGTADFADFNGLWFDYLNERWKNGGFLAPSEEALEMAYDMFVQAVQGNGTCVVAGETGSISGVLLWAPIFPCPIRGGYGVCGQGTYIRPGERQSGLAKRMYRTAMDVLKEKGVTHLIGSVDAGNEVGTAHAKTKADGGDLDKHLIQRVYLMEFY
jgi:hypothetical protein